MCAQAWAAVPNDRWTDRTVITAFPYSVVQTDIGSALFNSDEPIAPCFPNTLNPGNGVWYSYTTGADTEYLNLDTLGSNYDSVLSVWTGTPNHFELVGGGCNDNGNQDASANTARIAGLRLAPNTEYSILVTRATAGTGSMTLKLAIDRAPLYRVTRTGDRAGSVCAAGDCSLREAISAANAAPGAVLIPAGTYKIELAGAEDNNASGDFDLKAPMGLYGAGMGETIIDGNALDRVIHVDPTGTGVTVGRMTAHFADLTIRGGQTSSFQSGAGIFNNSGSAFLSLERVAVRDNTSIANGGGLQTPMRGYLREVLIRDNVANGSGGGINLSSTTSGLNFDIVGSAIIGNRANGTLTSGTGGGINSTQLVRISNSTIDGNEANHNGGGINVEGTNAELALYSSTITHNRADADANGSGSGGGLRFTSGKTSTVRNTVFAHNVDPNTAATTFGPDCSRNTPTLNVYTSLIADSRGGCNFTAVGNLRDMDPGFDGQLGDHGGPTPTLLPLATSPLVDAGDEAGCSDFTTGARAFDQRGAGHPRVVDGLGTGTPRCDIGAVEYEAPAVEPAAGVPALLAADDSGISSNDGITNVVQPRFGGSCRANATVHLLVDGVREADGVACADGRYLAAVAAALADGTHAVAAQALLDGEWAEPTAAIAVTIDTRAPVITFPEAPAPGITANETQFRVSVDEPVPALCSLDNETPKACRNPHTLFLLDMGVHRFVATATDLAGNLGRAEYVFERVELSPLEAPFLDASTDTGRSSTDGVTKADPIRIIGTCRNGDLVKVYDIDAYMNASGTCAGGVFSIDVAGATEGLRIVGVSATRAGLETTRSPGAFVLVDRTPPAAPTLAFVGTSGSRINVSGATEANADVTVVAGTQAFCGARAGSNGQWSCGGDLAGQATLTATATDVAGNTSDASAPLQIDLGPLAAPFLDPATDTGRSSSDGVTKADPIRITGTCQAGDLVKVYDLDTYLGASGSCNGGTFAINVAGAPEGLRVIGVTATRNGLETARSPGAFVLIDRTAPAAPTLVLPTLPDSSRITVSGTAEADADVTVLAGTQAFCGARAASNGQWSCTGDLNGQDMLTATATDVAGNTSVPSAPAQIDLSPLAKPSLDPATDSGRSNSDGITNASSIRITGTCRVGDLVKAYDADAFLNASTACSGGSFSFELAGLGEGQYTIGVSATRAGLETARSVGVPVLIDRTPPAAPTLLLPSVFDGPAFAVSGTAEADADVVVLAGAQPFCSARAAANGQWNCSGELAGQAVLSASATDAAGNTSGSSAPVQVVWDRVFGSGFDG
ncbi:MAG: hypothetical protein GXC76_01640 [Rhodanobacteraceae bacterium]|jgi:CSLREA domain-containing protein|nr:hypothetical protein [Rhodanobacteraceae bacterium]